MGEVSLRYRALVTGLTVWAGLCGTALPQAAAQGRFPTNQTPQTDPFGRKPSGIESISSTLKQGADKLFELLTPKTPVKPATDAVSLASEGRPRAKLYVSVAQMYEQAGRLNEAAEQYRKALKLTPNHLGALLGYARLKEGQGKPDEALELYKQAAKAHPNEASVFNNLGSFYGRRGMLNQSAAALGHAIQLQPRNPKYRNNLAIVLVEMGRMREAFAHLSAVHGEAVAYYNLGYVLYKKGQPQAARQHFVVALQKNPTLVQARQMLERLENVPMQARAPGGRSAVGVRVGSRPARPTQQAGPGNPLRNSRQPAVQELPPGREKHSPSAAEQDEWRGRAPHSDWSRSKLADPSVPWRIPPTSERPAVGPTTAPLPGGDYHRRPVPNAPLPPGK